MSTQTPPGAPSDPPPDSNQRYDAKAELAAAKARVRAERPWYKKKRFIGGGLLALLVIGSIAGGSSTETDDSASDSDAGSGAASSDAAKTDDDSCTNRATEDCTPEVASNRAVRVDALTWSIERTRTASTLGDQKYGLGEKADDTFLIVTLKVRSHKNESATLSDNSIKLESSDGNTYDVDSEGTIAAMGSGDDPLFLETIGPDQSTTSDVVFDVPQSVLDGGAKLRFNELGLGETHGYIKLPS